MSHKAKNFFIGTLLTGISLGFLETVSFGLLSLVIKPQDKTLLHRFPAQFRISRVERYNLFAPILGSAESKPLRWNQFEYDPVLGFRDQDFLTYFSPKGMNKFAQFNPGPDRKGRLQQWAAEFANEIRASNNPFVIVTLGGSTTATNSFGLNWPAYLGEQARETKFPKEVFVLNAGTNGFSSFQSKIYLTHWILPLLEEVNVTPNAVLSLDGVNDFLFGVQAYWLYEKENMPQWYGMYHGYHQLVARDVTRLQGKSSPSIITVNPKHWLVRKVLSATTLFLPYTSQVFQEMKSRRTPTTQARVATGGHYRLPEEAEQGLVRTMSHNLVDLAGQAHERKAIFVSYLQPVYLEGYGPGPLAEPHGFDSIECSPRHIIEMDLGGDFTADWKTLYRKAEKMYEEMNRSHPGAFVNLASVFKTSSRTTNYHYDSLHYSEKGSRLVARSIIEDVRRKLTKETQGLPNSTL